MPRTVAKPPPQKKHPQNKKKLKKELKFGLAQVSLTRVTPALALSGTDASCGQTDLENARFTPPWLGGFCSPAPAGLRGCDRMCTYMQPFCKLETVPVLGAHSPVHSRGWQAKQPLDFCPEKPNHVWGMLFC